MPSKSNPQADGPQAARARDIMRSDLVSISERASLRDLEQMLSDYRVSGMPVTDPTGQIIGVVSLRDLVDRYAGGEPEPDRPTPHYYTGLGETDWAISRGAEDLDGVVADIMTAQLHTVDASASLPEVAGKLTEMGLHRVLVSGGGSVVGMITTMDIVAAVAETK